MKKIEIELFAFSELSKESQKVAIENEQKQNWTNNYFYELAIDDCYLFGLKGIDDIIIKNNRKNIYYSIDNSWYIQFSKGAEILDNSVFKKYFGIPENHDFYLLDSNYYKYNSTELILINEFNEEYESEIISENWNNFIYSILNRIKNEIQYYHSPEYAENELSDFDECKFLSNGEIF